VLGNSSVTQVVSTGQVLAPFWNPTAQSSAYAANPGDMVLCTTTSAGFTVTIPAASSANKGQSIRVKKVSSDSNSVTVSAASNIDGQASWSITVQYADMEITSDGSTWWIA